MYTTHTYIHTYMHAYMHAYRQTDRQTYIHTYIRMYTYVCIYRYMHVCVCIYIYIYITSCILRQGREARGKGERPRSRFEGCGVPLLPCGKDSGGGDDTVGNPHRARSSQFELFELILLLKLDKQFPVERFEATVSQSTVPSPPLRIPPADAPIRSSESGA